jgi:Arylsulfotransferase (ASST)
VFLALGSAADVAAAQTAPQCVPATFDNSALQAGAVTVSPLAGSRDASPRTQISFLGIPISELKDVSVVGQRSGTHAGRLEAYSQGDGASFVPDRPFSEGERVTVRAEVRLDGSLHPVLDEFRVETIDPITTTPSPTHAGSASEVQHFASRPDLQPPVVTVTSDPAGSSPGYEFLAPYAGPGQAGPMIIEPDGQLVWFKALPANTSATDLRVQRYDGEPVLTWWQGDISIHGFGLGEDYIVNGDYDEVAHVSAANGYQADLHEFQITPANTGLITAYDPIRCDLAGFGGSADGAITDAVMQEIDIRTGLVMYEWTSLDHVSPAESFEPASRSSTISPWDYFHINSINLDHDGSLAVSSRNTWTVYDLDPTSGQIRWQLGGRHSSFSEPSSARTAWQHDAREDAEGLFSVFDNGSAPTVHTQSRGLVLRLQEPTRTASVVSEFVHSPPLVAESEGDLQLLEDGDWFVGWGQEPYLSEYSPQGALLFEAHLPRYDRSYRDLHYLWSSTPTSQPAFAFVRAATGAACVYASWNGATTVAAWRLLAGPTATALKAVAQVPRGGFETAIALPAGTGGPYLAVQALGASGEVLRSSSSVSERGL